MTLNNFLSLFSSVRVFKSVRSFRFAEFSREKPHTYIHTRILRGKIFSLEKEKKEESILETVIRYYRRVVKMW